MDGFEGNTGVIILAATNRPDSLDPALTLSLIHIWEEPQPKFQPPTMMSPGCTRFTKSLSISSMQWLASSLASCVFRSVSYTHLDVYKRQAGH